MALPAILRPSSAKTSPPLAVPTHPLLPVSLGATQRVQVSELLAEGLVAMLALALVQPATIRGQALALEVKQINQPLDRIQAQLFSAREAQGPLEVSGPPTIPLAQRQAPP